jgi:hypothetical protein
MVAGNAISNVSLFAIRYSFSDPCDYNFNAILFAVDYRSIEIAPLCWGGIFRNRELNGLRLYQRRIEVRRRTRLIVHTGVDITCNLAVDSLRILDIAHAQRVQCLVAYGFARRILKVIESCSCRRQSSGIRILFTVINLKVAALIIDAFFQSILASLLLTIPPSPSISLGVLASGMSSSSRVDLVEGRIRRGGTLSKAQAAPATSTIDWGRLPAWTIPPLTAPWYRVRAAESRLRCAVTGL